MIIADKYDKIKYYLKIFCDDFSDLIHMRKEFPEMKKLICATLAAGAICMALSSCEAKLFDNTADDTTAADTTVSLPELDENYDKNGNYILESSENRKVYSVPGGYVVFSFFGNTVQEIDQVYVFESKDEADSFADKCVKEDGMQRTAVSVNGTLVIVDVGFDPASDGYGKYYIYDRAKVESDFATDEDEIKWETN